MPLHWACRSGQEEMIQSLLDSGADVQALDNKELSPVSLAALTGQKHIVAQLINKNET
jgi:ankyrin repeat protein